MTKRSHTGHVISEKFAAACEKYAVLETDSILVGFSGGPDSTALLSLLAPVTREKGIRLVAIHVNHGIRDRASPDDPSQNEASRDEAFCYNYCASHGIPFQSFFTPVLSLAAKRKQGIEETARQERYRIFREYARDYGFSTIALAHNATDNLETILFHLTRGTALSGIAGIPPRRDNIVRPLIECTKDEILSFLESEKIPFVWDSSNADTAYVRNYIRHEIVPRLKKINPSVETAAGRFSRTVREDDLYLDRCARQYADADDLGLLSSLPQALLSRVLLIKIRQKVNNDKTADRSDAFGSAVVTADHISNLCKRIYALRQEEMPLRFSLPGKVAVLLECGKLSVVPDAKRRKKAIPSYPRIRPFPLLIGENVFSEHWTIVCCQDSSPFHASEEGCFSVTIDADRICGSVFVRSRIPGDVYHIRGMTKKMRKMLCDMGLSAEQRDTLPILCDSNGPLAVPFAAPDDRASPTKDTKCVLRYIFVHQ